MLQCGFISSSATVHKLNNLYSLKNLLRETLKGVMYKTLFKLCKIRKIITHTITISMIWISISRIFEIQNCLIQIIYEKDLRNCQ